MATSTLRVVHSLLSASQPNPSCNDMLCICWTLMKLSSHGRLTHLSPTNANVNQKNHGIGNTVRNAKTMQADLHHVGDL